MDMPTFPPKSVWKKCWRRSPEKLPGQPTAAVTSRLYVGVTWMKVCMRCCPLGRPPWEQAGKSHEGRRGTFRGFQSILDMIRMFFTISKSSNVMQGYGDDYENGKGNDYGMVCTSCMHLCTRNISHDIHPKGQLNWENFPLLYLLAIAHPCPS